MKKNITVDNRRAFLNKLLVGLSGAVLPWGAFAAMRSNKTVRSTILQEEKVFVPVMLTAYKDDGSIDYDGMDRLIDHYLAKGAKGFFANCLSSEMYDLSDEEKLKLTQHVVNRIKGKYPVVATGSFGETMVQKAEFAKRMKDTGVDAVILITSHFAGKEEGDATMIKNLEAFLKHTGDIPFGTYECPSPYKRILSPEVLRFLLQTDLMVYHKDTTENMAHITEKLSVSEGSRLGLYNAHIGSAVASLRAGAAGLSPIAGNFYPELITWVCDHASEPGSKQDADWLQQKLVETEPLISKQYQLGARYFLNKEGVNLAIKSRKSGDPLSKAQTKVLDRIFEDLQDWKGRLGIHTS
ncbi:dihydrodipicolinate synthase family protein [Negadavirga shengliensis]|uniref:Dihydrodipicolinate synthase family protein n=1 Tax=Negadavirga shengliensis TaxID=1389218 RepID=A0ABV9SUW3_9BACT